MRKLASARHVPAQLTWFGEGSMRKVTERPEVLEGGTVQVIENDSRKAFEGVQRIITNPSIDRRLHHPRFPFGRGHYEISRALHNYFSIKG